MSSRLRRPGWGPLNSTTFSWMGCTIAVYDYTVQTKRVCQGRKIPGCRRKRRGRRVGQKRRRARLVTSRSVPVRLDTAVSTARATCVVKAKQRYDNYVVGRARSITVLDQIRSKLPHGTSRRKAVLSDLRLAKERLYQVMMAAGRYDRPFSVIRLRVLLQIVRDGWDSIVTNVYDRPFESHGWEAGVGVIRSPTDWRAVPPPDSHFLVGIKNRSRVGKPSSQICRLCGERGHRSTACEAPLARGMWPTLASPPAPKPRGKQETAGPGKKTVSTKRSKRR